METNVSLLYSQSHVIKLPPFSGHHSYRRFVMTHELSTLIAYSAWLKCTQ